MNKSLLDTDILSELFRGKNPVISARAGEYRAEWEHYTRSVITVLEVVKGYRKQLRDDRIDDLLRSIEAEKAETLPVGCRISVTAGRLYADLERTGQTIGRSDPIIAAVAIEHGLTLVTGNTDHFRRIQDLGYPLALDDWRQL